MQNERSTSADELVQFLDRAVDGLLSWCTEFHAPFVTDQHIPDATQIQNAIRHLSPLVSWFQAHKNDTIVNQASVHGLLATLHDIRDKSLRVCELGHAMSENDYRALMADMRTFIESARRLERAFAAASSDLDALTGIQNRHAMHRALAHERERLLRSGQTSYIALADIDHFKSINDTHGHAVGDRVLAFIAGLLAQGLRAYDQVFRYGGEEFLLLLSDADADTAQQVLERLRATIESHDIPVNTDQPIKITTSFGAAPLYKGESIERTLERADQSLYAAKSTGRNRVIVAA